MNKNKIFLAKNFFNYEKVIGPPDGIPEELITVYLTDSQENADVAKELGWNYAVVNSNYLYLTDFMERRILIAKINCYPKIFISEIVQKYSSDLIFVCDSNIVKMWDKYVDFVNSCNYSKCLHFTSGYYHNTKYKEGVDRDNMWSEMDSSLNRIGWEYNIQKIITCTGRYITDLQLKGIDYRNLSLVSAKYLAWNISHKDYKFLSDILYNEYLQNLQGNIILTYMSGMYKDSINNYFCTDYTGFIPNYHNFLA